MVGIREVCALRSLRCLKSTTIGPVIFGIAFIAVYLFVATHANVTCVGSGYASTCTENVGEAAARFDENKEAIDSILIVAARNTKNSLLSILGQFLSLSM